MDYFKNQIKNNFIKLIVSIITNTKDETIDIKEEDINKYISLSQFHSIEIIILEAFKLNNIKPNDNFTKQCRNLAVKKITQEAELDLLSNAFSDNHLYHLPLKGAVISKYYPNTTYRNMADLDILIYEEDLNKAGSIVKELGYEVEHLGGNHDVYYKRPFMNIELHRNMIDPLYNSASYYDDIWDRVDKTNYRCNLSDDENYLFGIIHAGKHFASGGAGLRFLIDIYYIRQNIKINEEYITNELKKVDYDKFYTVIDHISTKLFNHEALDEDELYILNYLLTAGTYGTYENMSMMGVSSEDGDINKRKHKFFMRRVFPKRSQMEFMFPKLKEHPSLLWFYYIKRIFKVIFKSKTYKSQLKSLKEVNDDKLNKIKKIQTITGIRG